jgi:hypothetical protein
MSNAKNMTEPAHGRNTEMVTVQIPRAALTVTAPPQRFMRPDESPAGKRAILAAIERGELAKYKPGKVVLVERAEHDRWIERAKVTRVEMISTDGDDLDRELGLVGGGRRGR